MNRRPFTIVEPPEFTSIVEAKLGYQVWDALKSQLDLAIATNPTCYHQLANGHYTIPAIQLEYEVDDKLGVITCKELR